MLPNSIRDRLGIAPDERVTIVHADDLGCCHAANAAFQDNLAFGITTSGAVMVPSPWFPEVAAFCRAHPEADVGVHLTLTSEWETCRWGPVSTRDPASGLLDEEGYLPRSVAELHARMDPDAAVAEMRAQVERAISAGIGITHIDTHMGAIIHPQLLPAYIQLGLEFQVPVMLPRLSDAEIVTYGISPEVAAIARQQVAFLESVGMPVLDHIVSGTSNAPNPVDRYKRLFGALAPGITHLLYHPAKPGAEIAGLTDRWARRVADYEAMMSQELRAHVREEGIRLIGYRRLRDLMREFL